MNNRVIFKQLLQAEALEAVQLDSMRLAGLNEILSVMLMAAVFDVPVVPHAGSVALISGSRLEANCHQWFRVSRALRAYQYYRLLGHFRKEVYLGVH